MCWPIEDICKHIWVINVIGERRYLDVPGPSTSIYSSELKNPSNIKPTLREINKPTVAAQPGENSKVTIHKQQICIIHIWLRISFISANNVKGLATLSAAKVAKSMSFEAIESIYQSIKPREHLPESLMLPILRHCFPESEEDIRLYRLYFRIDILWMLNTEILI